MESQPAEARVVQDQAAEGMSGAVKTLLCCRGWGTALEVALMQLALVAEGTETATSGARLRARTSLLPVGHAIRLAWL